MRLLMAVLILMLGGIASAQDTLVKTPASTEIKFFPLGLDVRYEQSTELEWVARNSLNYSMGLQREAFGAVLEYSSFKESSGNVTLNTERKHQEGVLWGQWFFFQNKTNSGILSLFGALGLGGYQEQVVTTLSGSARTDDSGLKWMSGLAVGAEAKLKLSQRWGFVGSLEGRALTAPDFDTNPTWSGVCRLGLTLSL